MKRVALRVVRLVESLVARKVEWMVELMVALVVRKVEWMVELLVELKVSMMVESLVV